ncbi:hypothetical protein PUN4_990058 [Paraburkholderia unamae]|nr:hypothetical protein PUN4_990058 [Paraburkholderia unamae]
MNCRGRRLSPGIHNNFVRALERTRAGSDGITLGRGDAPSGPYEGTPEIFEFAAKKLLENPELGNEMFGPAAVLVRRSSLGEMLDVARLFDGQLSMAMHLETSDLEFAKSLMPIFERKTSREVMLFHLPPKKAPCCRKRRGPCLQLYFPRMRTKLGSC